MSSNPSLVGLLVRSFLVEELSKSSSLAARATLLKSKYGKKFKEITTAAGKGTRVGIQDAEVSKDEFLQILSSVFKLTPKQIKVLGPGEGANLSHKYSAYQFKYDGAEALLILAGKGKEHAERQERSLIGAINAIEGEKTLKFSNREFTGVESASKATASGHRYEPYADIVLHTTTGDRKISAKGPTAPSLGGGGLAGIDTLDNPQVIAFVEQFYKDALKFYKKEIDKNPSFRKQDLKKHLDSFPDLYRKVPENILQPLFRGSEAMGGPVDFYFKGSLDQKPKIEGQVISFEGNLSSVKRFSREEGPFYLRLRKREGPCYFDVSYNTNLKNLKVPKIFSNLPEGGDRVQTRLHITTKASEGRLI